MTVALWNPAAVISRLAALELSEDVKAFRLVAGAVEFAAAAATAPQTPSAFVLETSNRALPNESGSLVSQLVEVRFGVIYAVRNLRDPRGDAAKLDLQVLRQAVINSLHGWKETGTDNLPTEYAGGQVLSLDDQVLWWQDDFLTTTHFRSPEDE